MMTLEEKSGLLLESEIHPLFQRVKILFFGNCLAPSLSKLGNSALATNYALSYPVLLLARMDP